MIMIKYPVFYSATFVRDYDFIVLPGNDVPETVMSIFKKRISRLLMGDALIEHIKWLFDREIVGDVSYCLWGMACQNKLFSEIYRNDKMKRDLQCFIGVIYKTEGGTLSELPFDRRAFQDMFEIVMKKRWTDIESSSLSGAGCLVAEKMGLDYIRKMDSAVARLNFDQSVCRMFPGCEYEEQILFGAALASSSPVSVVSGILSRSEATSPEYEPFMNAVLVSDFGSVSDVPVSRMCRKCHKICQTLNDGLCSDCYDSEHAEREQEIKKEDFNSEQTRMIHCRQCGRLVERVNADGKCDTCRNSDKKKHLFIFVLALVVAALLLRKFGGHSVIGTSGNVENRPALHDSAAVPSRDTVKSVSDTLTINIQ